MNLKSRKGLSLVVSGTALLIGSLWISISVLAAERPESRARIGAGTLYAAHCARCHGPNTGSSEVISLSASDLKVHTDEHALERAIRYGHTTAQSRGWRRLINAPQMRSLALWIIGTQDFEHLVTQIMPRLSNEPVIGANANSIYHSELLDFRIQTVVSGLRGAWSMAFLADGSILITEKNSNSLRLVNNNQLDAIPIVGTPHPYVENETARGALMDVKLDPNYKRNGWIYLSYAEQCSSCPDALYPQPAPGSSYKFDVPVMIVIVRGRIVDHTWTDQQTIWRASQRLYSPFSTLHLSGEMTFDDRGYLYFAVGVEDHVPSFRQFAQDLGRPNGKIHRILADGRVPSDNPFIGETGALSTIWSYGHRVHEALAFDRNTGLLWSAEHGLFLGDELNLIRRGGNYGWPLASYGLDVDGTPIGGPPERHGLESAVRHWNLRLLPSRIHFYDGDKFANWKGNMFLASLGQRGLRRLTLRGRRVVHEESMLEGRGKFRDVTEGPDGYLYLILEDIEKATESSRILRIVPASMEPH